MLFAKNLRQCTKRIEKRPTTTGKKRFHRQTDKSNHILGFCPSEAELQEILHDLEEPQSNGYIHIDRFYPIMTKIFMEQK
jgi:hypothetical protein